MLAGTPFSATCGAAAAPLFTLVATVLDVAWLPAASNARAAIECAPFAELVELHVAENGAAVSVPASAPSTRNSTRATPTSSCAFAVSTTSPATVAPADGAVTDTVGAVV